MNAEFFLHLINGEQRRLCVKRVEDGFHQQYVRAAFNEPSDGFPIGLSQIIKRDIACAGVIHVW